MKLSYGAALAAFLYSVAAKDERTFAVLRFNNKALTKGRMDPIVSPGKASGHVHNVMGGSNFGMSATGEDLMNSKCSNAMIKGDNSAYWFPSVYFKDPDTGKFEDVEINYVNVYYFFEPTDDEIKAFPAGLQMVGGNAMTRTPPASAVTNLDPSQGDIMNVKFTCPRMDSNYNPPSWPADSDGTMAGMGDPINKGEGVGFPSVNCDGLYSPLRADVHMPSCYNPDAGLTNYQENMAFPEDNGQGKSNCPEGWIHVPHLFFEVYWDTPAFADRWTSNSGSQPFVLSNGDATGYASHADFMAGWDEDLLQHIIDTCDAGTAGMDNCPGLNGLNEDDCTIPSEVDEKVDGVMDSLPGNNILQGWAYGLDGVSGVVTSVVGGGAAATSTSAPSEPTSSAQDASLGLPETTLAQASSSEAGLPDASQPATNVVENPYNDAETTAESTAAAAVTSPAAIASSESASVAVPEPTTTSKASKCRNKVHTVWETVTVTADVYAEPTGLAATSSNSTGAVSGFQYAGCFKDASDRVLGGLVRPDIGTVSNDKCVTRCKEAGFLLAGTEYGGECYCGNELVGSEQLDDTDCVMACDADADQACGGDWALSVYSESGEAELKSAKVRRHLHGHHVHAHRRSHH